jgi:endonuclease III
LKPDFKNYIGPNGNARRIIALHKRLEKLYGPFKPFPVREGVEELVLTILSQNTNDINRDRAFGTLTRNYPTWDDVLNAPQKKIEDAIRVGGLAQTKSIAIQQILGEIKERYGKYTLEPISKLPIDEAIEMLQKFPHVGVKTAACVLAFSFGEPVIPVDTHVHRLSRRLGLAAKNASRDQAFYVLMEIVPQKLRYPFHVFLIWHGRAVCKSQKPLCGECVLKEMCESKGEW